MYSVKYTELHIIASRRRKHDSYKFTTHMQHNYYTQ